MTRPLPLDKVCADCSTRDKRSCCTACPHHWAPRFSWEETTEQPPPLQCQYCGRDLAIGTHRPTCRVVTEVDGVEIPAFLRRQREREDNGEVS